MPHFHPDSFFPEVFSSLRPYKFDVLNLCASREIAWSSGQFFGVCHMWFQVLGMFHLKALSLHFFIIKMVSYYLPGRFVGDQMRQRSWVDLVSYRFPIGFFSFLPTETSVQVTRSLHISLKSNGLSSWTSKTQTPLHSIPSAIRGPMVMSGFANGWLLFMGVVRASPVRHLGGSGLIHFLKHSCSVHYRYPYMEGKS